MLPFPTWNTREFIDFSSQGWARFCKTLKIDMPRNNTDSCSVNTTTTKVLWDPKDYHPEKCVSYRKRVTQSFHRLHYVCDLLAIKATMGLYPCTHCHSKVKHEIRQKLELRAHGPWVKVICKVIIHNWSLYYPGTALVDGNCTECILSFYAILSFLHDLVAPLS